jgi:hypothetical protein
MPSAFAVASIQIVVDESQLSTGITEVNAQLNSIGATGASAGAQAAAGMGKATSAAENMARQMLQAGLSNRDAATEMEKLGFIGSQFAAVLGDMEPASNKAAAAVAGTTAAVTGLRGTMAEARVGMGAMTGSIGGMEYSRATCGKVLHSRSAYQCCLSGFWGSRLYRNRAESSCGGREPGRALHTLERRVGSDHEVSGGLQCASGEAR